MTGPIVVINPNSNELVTAGIDSALAAYRLEGGPEIETLTLAEGPFGIESQLDVERVVMPLVDLVERRSDAAAFVIACYSDPGLDACRAAADAPVFGIQDCGILTAMAMGDMFGVVAISELSIARHRRYMRRMGVLDRLAGERPLGMTVNETATGEGTLDRLLEVGAALIGDGADIIVLGCAGMAIHRAAAEAALGVPVIDPCQAATATALGAVLSGRS